MTAVDLDALAPLDVAHRIEQVRQSFGNAKCDCLVVTKLENIRYLTGFSGSAGTLVVTEDDALFVTDGRYRDQAADQFKKYETKAQIEIAGGAATLDLLTKFVEKAQRIGLEADSISWSQARRLKERFEGKKVVRTSAVVEKLRIVKDNGEIARIEKACELADLALAQVKERLKEGITELDFAAELEFEMHRRGSNAPSFETIVASGPNGAMPHARPTGRTILPGELVVIDFGATVDGYKSDMTRTLCVGEPKDDLAELVDAVFSSQRAGILAVAAGVSGASVDAACREVLVDKGYGENFLHSTGHGVGLEIHEAPWVAASSADILPPGTVVTVEPGAYLPGRGGVRIEDTVVVTDAGARILTKSTKDYTL